MLLGQDAPLLNYGQVCQRQGASNFTHPRPRAAEYRHVFIGIALRVLVADIHDEPCQFIGDIFCTCQRYIRFSMGHACGLYIPGGAGRSIFPGGNCIFGVRIHVQFQLPPAK